MGECGDGGARPFVQARLASPDDTCAGPQPDHSDPLDQQLPAQHRPSDILVRVHPVDPPESTEAFATPVSRSPPGEQPIETRELAVDRRASEKAHGPLLPDVLVQRRERLLSRTA